MMRPTLAQNYPRSGFPLEGKASRRQQGHYKPLDAGGCDRVVFVHEQKKKYSLCVFFYLNPKLCPDSLVFKMFYANGDI